MDMTVACGSRKRLRSWSPVRFPQRSVFRVASLQDLPVEVLAMVLDHLCVADRLAVAKVSAGLRAACAQDVLYAAIGNAVLGMGATSRERWAWGWFHESQFSVPPPLPQTLILPEMAAGQGRAIVCILRAVMALSELWDTLDGTEAGSMDLLFWADHLLKAHPTGLTYEVAPTSNRGRCIQCDRHGVRFSIINRLWGFSMDQCYTGEDQHHWYQTNGDNESEMIIDAWAVLRMAFFSVDPPMPGQPIPLDHSWGMTAVLDRLRLRACRAVAVMQLVRERVEGKGGMRAGGSGALPARPHFWWWVRVAVRAGHGPIARYCDGAAGVDDAVLATALDYLASVYDGVMDEWPALTRSRRCTHWADLEQHVTNEAMNAAFIGGFNAGTVAEAVLHAECVGLTRLCTAWGRRVNRAAACKPTCAFT